MKILQATLANQGLPERDIEHFTNFVLTLVAIMAGGPRKGYSPQMSHRCGFEWIMGDLEKRRTSLLAAHRADRLPEEWEEMCKIATDAYIGYRDFIKNPPEEHLC